MGKRVKPKKRLDLNPVSGEFDLITDNNFSYEGIPENRKLEIPENMQMKVCEEFDMEENTELRLDGSIIIEE